MMFGEERVFLLDNSLHSSFFQVEVNGLRGESLVGDGLKCFGHLNSLVNLARGDKAHRMTNVGISNFGRTASQSLRKVRAILEANAGDSRSRDPSGELDLMARLARIK